MSADARIALIMNQMQNDTKSNTHTLNYTYLNNVRDERGTVENVLNNIKKRSNVNMSTNWGMSSTNLFGHDSVI